MNTKEAKQAVYDICRVRRLSRHTADTYSHWIARYCQHATNLLSSGASITQVQELLGHTSVETTQVYLHCIPQFAQTITSPLDAAPSPIIPFPASTHNQPTSSWPRTAT